jgi:hypothetical protein
MLVRALFWIPKSGVRVADRISATTATNENHSTILEFMSATIAGTRNFDNGFLVAFL